MSRHIAKRGAADAAVRSPTAVGPRSAGVAALGGSGANARQYCYVCFSLFLPNARQ